MMVLNGGLNWCVCVCVCVCVCMCLCIERREIEREGKRKAGSTRFGRGSLTLEVRKVKQRGQGVGKIGVLKGQSPSQKWSLY